MMLNMAWSMLFNSAIDEFEYTVFNADPAMLNESYLNNTFNNIMKQYWPYGVGYSFYQIPHIFESPAYCISYATSLSLRLLTDKMRRQSLPLRVVVRSK